MWRNTHNNTTPCTIWFQVTLADTDLNIQGIQVKYHTCGNPSIPATESKLWVWARWHYLFSAPVYMLLRGAVGCVTTNMTKDFNGTIIWLTSQVVINWSKYRPGLPRSQWIVDSHPVDISTFFPRPLAVSMHTLRANNLPAASAVKRSCVIVYVILSFISSPPSSDVSLTPWPQMATKRHKKDIWEAQSSCHGFMVQVTQITMW